MSHPAGMERALVDLLRCPLCGATLAWSGGNSEACCTSCSACYPCVSGIWRMLTEAQQQRYAPFMRDYHAIRQREGWERDESYYLSLPNVPQDDPTAQVWRIRRRSLAALDAVVPPGGGKWALDLGAGNGWLSRYLTRKGYRTVAVDLNVGGLDSLEGGRVYMERDGIWFGRVQASMDSLPFVENAFALCTISAALHYADTRPMLQAVHRTLEPGGTLAITDSPVYSKPEPGKEMAAGQRARLERLLGHSTEAMPGGEGFLVMGTLLADMRSTGFRPRVLNVERLPARVRRRLRSLLPGQREHARFPVVLGVKL